MSRFAFARIHIEITAILPAVKGRTRNRRGPPLNAMARLGDAREERRSHESEREMAGKTESSEMETRLR
ncbi:unnamed protein product [Victoria cruziana]